MKSQKTGLILAVALLAIGVGVATFFVFRDQDRKIETLTAEQLSRYEEGTFYRTTVTSTVQGKIEDKDWGVEKAVTLVHQGEIDFVREVKSVNPDHTEVVVGLEILTARDLEVKLDLGDVKLDLPPAVSILGKSARKWFFTGPAGVVADEATKRAADWLRSEENRGKVLAQLNRAVSTVTGKGIEEHLLEANLQPLEAYEGLTADYTYEAGKGLTDFQTQASLSKEQEARVREFSVYSEAYLLPDTDVDGAKEWDVDVKTIAHLLAPGSALDVGGTLTFSRDGTENNVTKLRIVKGKVVFSGKNDTTKVLGTWAARGSLFYDLNTHNILEGNLTGEVTLEQTSTDHVLFEAKFSAKPNYRVVMSGFSTKDSEEAKREIAEVTLKK